MNEALESLIVALREELKHYGEMLALLDLQQQHAMERAVESLLQTIVDIQAQGHTLQAARLHRDACRQQLARILGQPDTITFNEMIPLLPFQYRPLVEALVEENNALLFRIQQRARQNHLLLSRSVELMQRFMNTLFPGRETLVYNGHGTMGRAAVPVSGLYEAVG